MCPYAATLPSRSRQTSSVGSESFGRGGTAAPSGAHENLGSRESIRRAASLRAFSGAAFVATLSAGGRYLPRLSRIAGGGGELASALLDDLSHVPEICDPHRLPR